MFIRLFIHTTSQDEANNTVNDVLREIKPLIIKVDSIKIEPYWKFDNVMVAELRLSNKENLVLDEIKTFLYFISNVWDFLKSGDEALSSYTMEGCILKYNLEMIHVLYEISIAHEFVVLTIKECRKKLSLNDIRATKKVLEIQDYIILYINDSLKWVPQASNSQNIKYGLNYSGITEIDKDGARVLYNILRAWSELFKNSPSKLILTGEYTYLDDVSVAYKIHELCRDEVIDKFEELISFTKIVEENNYHYRLLHFGSYYKP